MLKGQRKGRGEHAKYISVHVSPRTSIFLRDLNTKNSLKIGSITTADYSVKLTKQPGSQAEPTKGHFAASVSRFTFDVQNVSRSSGLVSCFLSSPESCFNTFFNTTKCGGICTGTNFLEDPMSFPRRLIV